MLPLIALLLPVLVLFIGFSVDLAYMQNTRLELRVATDSAARAAATKLSATDSVAESRSEAKAIAEENKVAGEPLLLADDEIEFGRSELNDDLTWTFSSGMTPYNSVRVTSGRTATSLSGPVSLFFGSFFGVQDFQPVQTATASFLNIDICLVLDRSTSMKVNVNANESGMYTSDSRFCRAPNNNSRWMALDAAVRIFTSELRDTTATENVALASYSSALNPNSYCGASWEPASLDIGLGDNLDAVDTALNTLSNSVWNGNTDIESGMRVAIEELTSSNARTNASKIMIVFTDGQENVGSSEVAATDAKAEGITIHTITLGDYANQDTMKSVAAIGLGRHIHADDADALAEAFRELAAQVAQLTH